MYRKLNGVCLVLGKTYQVLIKTSCNIDNNSYYDDDYMNI